ELGEDKALKITLETQYPANGYVKLMVSGSGRLAVRIPGYVTDYVLKRNGERVTDNAEDGYIYLDGPFSDDEIVLEFEQEPILWRAHPYVRSDAGKVALSRGPFIYCLEGVDNGEHLECLSIGSEAAFRYEEEEDDKLGRIGVIYAEGLRQQVNEKRPLYVKAVGIDNAEVMEPQELRFIPYYAWANRGENEMSVWIREFEW
ncbi:MAG: glycoside hydrolase family 127 protein, partial [Lachnospiraceae bacterium]|nr:glycoside hydrolase family 127 protein [Lachnospiraceae bacterium]